MLFVRKVQVYQCDTMLSVSTVQMYQCDAMLSVSTVQVYQCHTMLSVSTVQVYQCDAMLSVSTVQVYQCDAMSVQYKCTTILEELAASTSVYTAPRINGVLYLFHVFPPLHFSLISLYSATTIPFQFHSTSTLQSHHLPPLSHYFYTSISSPPPSLSLLLWPQPLSLPLLFLCMTFTHLP